MGRRTTNSMPSWPKHGGTPTSDSPYTHPSASDSPTARLSGQLALPAASGRLQPGDRARRTGCWRNASPDCNSEVDEGSRTGGREGLRDDLVDFADRSVSQAHPEIGDHVTDARSIHADVILELHTLQAELDALAKGSASWPSRRTEQPSGPRGAARCGRNGRLYTRKSLVISPRDASARMPSAIGIRPPAGYRRAGDWLASCVRQGVALPVATVRTGAPTDETLLSRGSRRSHGPTYVAYRPVDAEYQRVRHARCEASLGWRLRGTASPRGTGSSRPFRGRYGVSSIGSTRSGSPVRSSDDRSFVTPAPISVVPVGGSAVRGQHGCGLMCVPGSAYRGRPSCSSTPSTVILPSLQRIRSASSKRSPEPFQPATGDQRS